VQHVRQVQLLRRSHVRLPTISVSAVIALLFSAFGTFTFIAVMLRR